MHVAGGHSWEWGSARVRLTDDVRRPPGLADPSWLLVTTAGATVLIVRLLVVVTTTDLHEVLALTGETVRLDVDGALARTAVVALAALPPLLLGVIGATVLGLVVGQRLTVAHVTSSWPGLTIGGSLAALAFAMPWLERVTTSLLARTQDVAVVLPPYEPATEWVVPAILFAFVGVVTDRPRASSVAIAEPVLAGRRPGPLAG